MKTQRSIKTQGSALLATIVITGLIGFVLAAYLTLVSSQNQTNQRSQSWNSAMPVVEAGIEEALAHLNAHGLNGQSLEADGWARSGNTYTVVRTLGDSQYTVTITNYFPGNPALSPIVESRGYVVAPLQFASVSGPLLANAGSVSPTVQYLGRGVRVNTRRDALFAKGMVARISIDLNGNNITTDSFDSTNPLYSTNGLYHPSKRRTNGDIAVNGDPTTGEGGVLDVGNANIFGHVSLGPDTEFDINNGRVGDATWNQNGVQPGFLKRDMNVSFPEVEVPFTGGYTPTGGYFATIQAVIPPVATGGRVVRTNYVTSLILPPGTPGPIVTNGNGQNRTYTYKAYTFITPTNSAGGTYYNYVLWDENYVVPNLDGKVLVLGNANLYASSGCNVSGLTVEWGKHLNLYSSAPSVALSGNSTANSDGTADSFAFWGTTNVTSISFSGNAGFTGSIYAPEADFTLNGTGNSTTIDFIGASVTKNVKMNGHFNFHYDEALAVLGPNRAFVITSWSELTPNEIPRLTTTRVTYQ